MGNTLKIWKIGKYWEIRTIIYKKDLLYFILCFFFKKNIFKLYMLYYFTAPFKICYKMKCIGALYKMKMKAASL